MIRLHSHEVWTVCNHEHTAMSHRQLPSRQLSRRQLYELRDELTPTPT